MSSLRKCGESLFHRDPHTLCAAVQGVRKQSVHPMLVRIGLWKLSLHPKLVCTRGVRCILWVDFIRYIPHAFML